MTIRERVNNVLVDWCGVAPNDQMISLEVVWTSNNENPTQPNSGVAFQPDGVRNLLAKLNTEFTNPGDVLKDISRLTASRLTEGGDINTVADLIAAVRDAPMPIRRRTNIVLSDWCGEAPSRIDQGMSLDVLWTATRNNPNRPHNGIAFQPEGVVDLLTRLGSEFTKPGPVRKRTSVLTPNSFKPSGNIDSTDNLVEGIVGCPNLPPILGGD